MKKRLKQVNETVQSPRYHGQFNKAEAPGHPLHDWLPTSSELGIITVNIQEFSSSRAQPSAQQVKQQFNLPKFTVLREYQDFFDKIGRYPGDKYHIQLIDDPKPGVYPPRTVPVHIIPL